MNIHFKTLGCKVNQYETQAMSEGLIRLGHTADSSLPADAVIINSCTVTAESDRKTRQILHSVKRDNPGAVVVLTGCMVQAFPEKAKALTDADVIIGNRDIKKVIEAVNSFKNNDVFSVESHSKSDKYCTPSITDFSERTRAFMKIEDGCNRYCSYCIIPKARGFVRSRPLNDIKEEAKKLADNGYFEVVLVGINLSAYGQGENINLCDAVSAVAAVPGVKRVRLGSLEPDHITDEMLSRLRSEEKFCPQFHLSLQSGCDETLKRMNRHYDTAFYLDLVNRIRAAFPTAAITTDIMVGFAGETEDEFKKSVEFFKKVGFARAHIFTYSRRAGTVADGFPDQISKAEKQHRAAIMASAAEVSQRSFLLSQVDKVSPVLFETAKNGAQWGYTPNYIRVCVNNRKSLTGQILPVLITSAESDYCMGKIH